MRVMKENVPPSRNKIESEISGIKKQFETFILDKDHPCLMAKTVFSMDQVELHSYRNMGSIETAADLITDLENYIENYDFESNDFRTFIAVFPDSPEYSEIEFEEKLWEQLENLHKADKSSWDAEVSSDPESEHFSFSICEKAFYIVGMHPGASRMARRSPYTTMVFNLHWQFEKLREMGTYKTVKSKIRDRDKELQGTINPMLEDFGKKSEARQYSGRKVSQTWKCPFHNN